MDLQEEYFTRRAVRGHMVKFSDRGTLILKARDGLAKKPEWSWLHITLTSHADGAHPQHYNFQVAANPVIYASTDFSHFTYHHSKVLSDVKYEFDAFEQGILDWCAKTSQQYTAILSTDAVFVSWEMFCQNYDSWLANFLTWRMTEILSQTLTGTKESRLKHIQEVENWIREKHERVHLCWKNIRANLEEKNYADWLGIIVNNMKDNQIVAYTKEQLRQLPRE